MSGFDLVGGAVLGPEGLAPGRVSFAGGRIVGGPVGRAVDLAGFAVLPGIVDMHGDGFESHLAPRRGAMPDLREGLVAAAAELAANGITTAVLAQFLSWEGGLRGGAHAEAVFAALRSLRGELATTLIPQLRLETHLLEEYATLPERLAEWGVGFVVFNDHLPHGHLAEGRRPPALTGQALKAGRSPEAHWALLRDLHARGPEVPGALDGLCARLAAQGVVMGSHDDHGSDRSNWAARGVAIAEFPETRAAAEAARGHGAGVVLGSPNVVRGGSHKGNASARDLVTLGLCDALASDYHYPSPRRAALLLAEEIGLAAAWALVSSGPAQLLGLADRGRLMPGLRADLLVLDGAGRVAATMAAGRFTYLAGEAAERFLG